MFFMLVGVLLLREARAFLSIHYINDALNLYQNQIIKYFFSCLLKPNYIGL